MEKVRALYGSSSLWVPQAEDTFVGATIAHIEEAGAGGAAPAML